MEAEDDKNQKAKQILQELRKKQVSLRSGDLSYEELVMKGFIPSFQTIIDIKIFGEPKITKIRMMISNVSTTLKEYIGAVNLGISTDISDKSREIDFLIDNNIGEAEKMIGDIDFQSGAAYTQTSAIKNENKQIGDVNWGNTFLITYYNIIENSGGASDLIALIDALMNNVKEEKERIVFLFFKHQIKLSYISRQIDILSELNIGYPSEVKDKVEELRSKIKALIEAHSADANPDLLQMYRQVYGKQQTLKDDLLQLYKESIKRCITR